MSSSATLPLSKLREGQKGQVSDLLLSGEMRRRLQDLGLIPGTCVSCLYQSAFGDPCAYSSPRSRYRSATNRFPKNSN